MDVSSHICLVLLNVRDNEKLEMQPFFCIYYDVYTTDDTKRIHETERMQISNLKNDALLPSLGCESDCPSHRRPGRLLVSSADDDLLVCKLYFLVFSNEL